MQDAQVTKSLVILHSDCQSGQNSIEPYPVKVGYGRINMLRYHVQILNPFIVIQNKLEQSLLVSDLVGFMLRFWRV